MEGAETNQEEGEADQPDFKGGPETKRVDNLVELAPVEGPFESDVFVD
jgi:hypothetical protein